MIELIYIAEDGTCYRRTYNFHPNRTAKQWIEYSDFYTCYPALKQSKLSLGIFSQKITDTRILQPGDRLEIYQALRIDPKTARRLRK